MDRQVSRIKNSQIKLSSCYRKAIKSCPQQNDLNGSSNYRVYRNFLDRSKSCQEAIKLDSQKPQWIEIAITTMEKKSSRGSIDSLTVERYPEAVEIAQNQFFKE